MPKGGRRNLSTTYFMAEIASDVSNRTSVEYLDKESILETD